MADYITTGDMGRVGITQIRTKKGGRIVDDGTKNLRGILGPICNYCAGLGFTNSITGGTLQCRRCDGKGIEPVDSRDLQKQIDQLKEAMLELRDIIVKYSKEKIK